MEAIKLDLPEFAFLDGNSPEGNTLENRTVVLHIRTATVLEFFHNEVILRNKIIRKEFSYKNRNNIIEQIVCAVHHSPLIEDKYIIICEIVDPAIEWYKEHLDWEDDNIDQDNNSINN